MSQGTFHASLTKETKQEHDFAGIIWFT